MLEKQGYGTEVKAAPGAGDGKDSRVKISDVTFAGAAGRPGRYPTLPHPEIAFAGRSNVGKSSLINRLLERRIAHVGATPGRTRQLNFFTVNDALTFVDLPGYGYARVAKSERRAWQKLIEDYLRRAPKLCGVVIIIDIRRGPEDEETALGEFLTHHHRPFVFVATKCDKLSRLQRDRQRRALAGRLGAQPLVLFSARDGSGRDVLWQTLLDLAFPRMADSVEPARTGTET